MNKINEKYSNIKDFFRENFKENYDKTKNFLKKNYKVGLYAGILTASGFFAGCEEGFWETNFIEKNTKKILERKEAIEERYRQESGIRIIDEPGQLEKPVITKNLDKTYTLFYRGQFTEASKLEKIIKEQVEDAIVSQAEKTNQLVVRLKDENQVNYVEGLLNKIDNMPSQVLLKLNIYNDYGDWTRDFAAHLGVSFGSNGTIGIDSSYPGASTRVGGRADIGTKYGIEFNDGFKIKAILDVLESLGFVDQIYQTTLLVSNRGKGVLNEEEKLPIPTYVVAGQNVVQTYQLESVKSFFEATPIIYDNGLVELSFKAGIGSSKRPEGPIQWPVPTKDEVGIDSVYLRVGQPLLVAGKLNNLEVGVKRKDPILPFLKSKDWEKRVSRIWYEITPLRVIYTKEPEKLPEEIKLKVTRPKEIFESNVPDFRSNITPYFEKPKEIFEPNVPAINFGVSAFDVNDANN